MPINVNTTPEQISVSVGETKIDVNVDETKVDVNFSGGVGPAGFTTLEAATDVNLEATSDGDVLRYSSGKWRNYPDANLVDGGNW